MTGVCGAYPCAGHALDPDWTLSNLLNTAFLSYLQLKCIDCSAGYTLLGIAGHADALLIGLCETASVTVCAVSNALVA